MTEIITLVGGPRDGLQVSIVGNLDVIRIDIHDDTQSLRGRLSDHPLPTYTHYYRSASDPQLFLAQDIFEDSSGG